MCWVTIKVLGHGIWVWEIQASNECIQAGTFFCRYAVLFPQMLRNSLARWLQSILAADTDEHLIRLAQDKTNAAEPPAHSDLR